ncbi:MAG: pirin family protein [Deltaproteobacteria bacterium]|nr:pirin family protein [Deltaproteobacteria bacterium]
MSSLTRREALHNLAAAASAAAVPGCAPKPTPAARPAAVPEVSAMTAHLAAAGVDPVLSQHPLEFVWKTFDPFLFCVHHDDAYPKGNAEFGPQASLAGRDIGQDFAGLDGWRMYHGRKVPGFPSHPHRGFETVTVVRRGLLDHADSMGAAARYGQGDVQWLTAGRGIQHAEMFPLLRQDADNPVELFQIWLNLPKADKMATPHFSMLWNDAIGVFRHRDEAGRATEVKVVAGVLAGVRAPPPPPNSYAAKPDSDLAIWPIRLEGGATWTLPPAQPTSNRTLYFFAGTSLRVGPRDVPLRHAVRLRPDVPVVLRAGEGVTQALVLQGKPIGEPVVQYGPFVMNTREEIAQAYSDYQRTAFGGWPWPRHDPVHGAEPQRFARRPDGTIEKPA